MPLFGNQNIANNAPLFKPLRGIGVGANGQGMFANTTPNGFHANLTSGVWGVGNDFKLAAVLIDNPGQANVGTPSYAINDLISFSQAGATGNANGDATVTSLQVVNVTGIQVLGTSYNIGDRVSILGPANTVLATANVATVGAVATGNITSLLILTGGNYTANFASFNGISVANVTGIGTGAVVNVAVGVKNLTVHNTGSYITLPTSANGVAFTGGSGLGANANLTFSTDNQRVGHGGWVLKQSTTRIYNGVSVTKNTFEVLVASGTIPGSSTEQGGLL